MLNFLKKTGRLLFEVAMPFYIPTSSGGKFQVFHTLAALGVVSLFDSSLPPGRAVSGIHSTVAVRPGRASGEPREKLGLQLSAHSLILEDPRNFSESVSLSVNWKPQ